MDRFIINRMSGLELDHIRETQYLLFPSKKVYFDCACSFPAKMERPTGAENNFSGFLNSFWGIGSVGFHTFWRLWIAFTESSHNFQIKISLFSFVHDIKLGGQFSGISIEWNSLQQ